MITRPAFIPANARRVLPEDDLSQAILDEIEAHGGVIVPHRHTVWERDYCCVAIYMSAEEMHTLDGTPATMACLLISWATHWGIIEAAQSRVDRLTLEKTSVALNNQPRKQERL